MFLILLLHDNCSFRLTDRHCLHRKAGIPCAIVEGYGKSVSYEVGSSEEAIKELRNSWNAVYCDGFWRLIFPLWACSGVVGHASGSYTKVESKGIKCL